MKMPSERINTRPVDRRACPEFVEWAPSPATVNGRGAVFGKSIFSCERSNPPSTGPPGRHFRGKDRILTFRLGGFRLTLFGSFGQCQPKNYSPVTPYIAPLPPPWISHPITTPSQFGVGLSHSGRRDPSHLGTRDSDHEINHFMNGYVGILAYFKMRINCEIGQCSFSRRSDSFAKKSKSQHG